MHKKLQTPKIDIKIPVVLILKYSFRFDSGLIRA